MNLIYTLLVMTFVSYNEDGYANYNVTAFFPMPTQEECLSSAAAINDASREYNIENNDGGDYVGGELMGVCVAETDPNVITADDFNDLNTETDKAPADSTSTPVK